MADNRDPVNGQFIKIKTSNTPESSAGKFETYANDLPVSDVSGAPSPNTIEHPRHAPVTDSLAGSGPSYGSARLRARNATLVHPDDEGHHNAVLRSAARGGSPDDPTSYLVGGIDG